MDQRQKNERINLILKLLMAILFTTGAIIFSYPFLANAVNSYKLLTASERQRGLWIPRNMLAELRGDTASRIAWYKGMREIGAYSVNDILEKEDEPPVPGGDARLASLNYVPLESFERLSIARNDPAAAPQDPTE